MKERRILSLLLAAMLIVTSVIPVLADTENDAGPAPEAGQGIVVDAEAEGAGTEQPGGGTPENPAAEEPSTETPDPGEPAGETPSAEEPPATTETPILDKPAEVVYKKAKSTTIRDFSLVFKSAVVTNVQLDKVTLTDSLKATGKAKKIKLTWKAASNTKAIDGYIILRKDKTGGKWRQIGTAGKTATSYTDKTAKTKNRMYKYTIVAYDDTSKGRMITRPVHWAGAVTTKSKKKNVYSISVKNHARSAALRTGTSVKIKIKFPSKAASKDLRWTSSNNKVATVDSNGKVTAIRKGKATISARTHTGYVRKVKVTVVNGGTASAMIETMESWYGYSYTNGKHRGIVDIYNADKPLPFNYEMGYYDAWCAASVTAASIVTANTARTGKECSVDRFITIFKNKGIWEEDGTITPEPGDFIIYSWRKGKQPNNKEPSHIGIVEKVENGKITAIEGNMGIGIVGRRTIPVGWGYIRGYAQPDYKEE